MNRHNRHNRQLHSGGSIANRHHPLGVAVAVVLPTPATTATSEHTPHADTLPRVEHARPLHPRPASATGPQASSTRPTNTMSDDRLTPREIAQAALEAAIADMTGVGKRLAEAQQHLEEVAVTRSPDIHERFAKAAEAVEALQREAKDLMRYVDELAADRDATL